MERAYRNLGYFLLALLPIFVAGFWVPYLSEIPAFDPSITLPVHVHAVLLFAWIALLVFQPLAIRYRAFAAHRLLGKASYVVMALIVPFAVAMMWKEYHEKLSDGQTVTYALGAEFISASQLVVIVAMYVLAIVRIQKRDVPAHMRYMICIAIFLLPAGLARVLGYWFDMRQVTSQTICLAVMDSCLGALIAFDIRRQLNARPYVLAFLIYNTTAVAWMAFGRARIGLRLSTLLAFANSIHAPPKAGPGWLPPIAATPDRQVSARVVGDRSTRVLGDSLSGETGRFRLRRLDTRRARR